MDSPPKSFWPDRPAVVDDPGRRRSPLDALGLRTEADIIAAIHRVGITLPQADGYELWELAAACGLHLYEAGVDDTTAAVQAQSKADYENPEYREARMRKAEKAAANRRRR